MAVIEAIIVSTTRIHESNPPSYPLHPISPISSPRAESLLTDQALVVDEGVAHEGCDGLVRGGGAAECRALHGDEHKGDGSGKDEGGLHVVAVGKFKFNSNSKVKWALTITVGDALMLTFWSWSCQFED